ncbi:anthranilate synthase family protein [Streptomyces albus]|uniref:anthranilate synthase family protein n=1 Tax=Streptomyces TaxID=1883 RepID=UPI00068F4A41|nr:MULTISPECIES: anthranilate synthase family protein [Streptomyces]QID34670.1 phenazine-specific anthranilate synthase component I [Streptomyces albus]
MVEQPTASAESAPAARRSAPAPALERLLRPDPGPFALLWRPAAHGRDVVELLTGPVRELGELGELRAVRDSGEAAGPGQPARPGALRRTSGAVLALLPFRQVTERGFACHDGKEPLLAMPVAERAGIPVADVLARLDRLPSGGAEAAFDLDDGAYAKCVRRVIDEEIATGAGANFVLARTLSAQLPGRPHLSALAVFGRLLRQPGAYWTFVVHTGDRTFVGATPERHVCLHAGRAVMNPVSGTYRHPSAGPQLSGLIGFLADRKETDELSMVVDEELKMMAAVCPDGARLRGPYLKTMARLSHTEYLLEGASDRDPVDILRATMFAPTVTGSPLENACRVIAQHEHGSRGYYSGVAALIDTDGRGRDTLDSAILIRTAHIDPVGTLRLSVGATLVRHSDPASEAAETRAKAAGLLDAAGLRLAGEPQPADPATAAPTTVGPGLATPAPAANEADTAVRNEHGTAPRGRPYREPLAAHPRVRAALARRNAPLAGFWLADPPGPVLPPGGPPLRGTRVLVVDAEDTFTGMLAIQLRALGAHTTVVPHHRAGRHLAEAAGGLVVIGPGPGDPRDRTDPRIRTVRAVVARLLAHRAAFVAVCLGHQILAGELGLALRARPVPHQGIQREIDLFGRRAHVGFYNSFAAYATSPRVRCPGVAGEVLVCRDAADGEVHALRGPGFASAQFHPESVLSRDGIGLLADLARTALTSRPATAAVPAALDHDRRSA